MIDIIVNALVAIGTLTLAYMAYRSIRESRLQRSMEIHSEETRSFLKWWKEKLPSPPEPGERISLIAPFYTDLLQNPLFEDLKSHLPLGNQIMKHWEELKESFSEYEKSKNDLYDRLCNELQKRVGLPISKVWAPECLHLNVANFFYDELIYAFERGKLRTEEARLLEYFSSRWGKPWELRYDGYGWVSRGDEATLERDKIALVGFHNELIGSEWQSEVEKIYRLKGEISKRRQTLLFDLDFLAAIPVYRGECDIIKSGFR